MNQSKICSIRAENPRQQCFVIWAKKDTFGHISVKNQLLNMVQPILEGKNHFPSAEIKKLKKIKFMGDRAEMTIYGHLGQKRHFWSYLGQKSTSESDSAHYGQQK